jgi:hypothetical protein
MFQTHYFSENVVAPEIEPGTAGSIARASDYYSTEAVVQCSTKCRVYLVE